MIGGGYFQFIGNIRFLVSSICIENKGGTTRIIVPEAMTIFMIGYNFRDFFMEKKGNEYETSLQGLQKDSQHCK